MREMHPRYSRDRTSADGELGQVGAPCAFPFNYRSSLRHSCAPTSDAPDAMRWCPREVDAYGDCVENMDGRCIAGECRWGCTQAIPGR